MPRAILLRTPLLALEEEEAPHSFVHQEPKRRTNAYLTFPRVPCGGSGRVLRGLVHASGQALGMRCPPGPHKSLVLYIGSTAAVSALG